MYTPRVICLLLLAVTAVNCKSVQQDVQTIQDSVDLPVQQTKLQEEVKDVQSPQESVNPSLQQVTPPEVMPQLQEVSAKVEETIVQEAKDPEIENKGSRQSRKRVTSLNDALRCGLDVPCFLEKLQDVLDDRKNIMLAEADARYMASSLARAQSSESPSELAQTVEGLINKMTAIVKDTVSSWLKAVKFEAEEDTDKETEKETESAENETDNTAQEDENETEDETDIAEEGRGKKKKKLKSLIKLLIIGAVLKAKLTVLLQLLSAALQIKFFLIALAGLLINKIRLWYDLKKGHNPQKVIYYEHAQHQHHYDHLEDDHSSHGGGFWGRAYEVPEEEDSAQQIVYRGQRPMRPIPWNQQQH